MTRSLPEDPLIRSLVIQARRAQLTRRSVLAGRPAGAAALALAACAPTGSVEADAGDRQLGDRQDADLGELGALHRRGRRRATTRRSTRSPRRPASRSSTRSTSTTTTPTTPRSRTSSRSGRTSAPTPSASPTGWSSRWIRFGYTQELDHAKIPNIKNLNPDLLNVDFDPGRKQSLPVAGRLRRHLLEQGEVPEGPRPASTTCWDPELKGRVGVLSEMRDTIGLIMLEQGVDISGDWGDDEFQTALDVLPRAGRRAARSATSRATRTLEDLQNGDTLAAIVLVGRHHRRSTPRPATSGSSRIPEAGGTLWNDNFADPDRLAAQGERRELINYYYDPEVAAEVAAWVNYITPVVGAKEAADEDRPGARREPADLPRRRDARRRSQVFRTLTPAQEQTFSAAFQSVLLGA